METQKHDYDKAGHFKCWNTEEGHVCVEPASVPGAVFVAETDREREALRWGIESATAAAERRAAERHQAIRVRELKAYQHKIEALVRLVGLQRENTPLRAFRVVMGATYWIAARTVAEAVAIALDDEGMDDSDRIAELESGIACSPMTDEEQQRLRIHDDADDSKDTVATWIEQLNTNNSPPMMIGCSEW